MICHRWLFSCRGVPLFVSSSVFFRFAVFTVAVPLTVGKLHPGISVDGNRQRFWLSLDRPAQYPLPTGCALVLRSAGGRGHGPESVSFQQALQLEHRPAGA